jgi:hypothetical protein
VSGPFHEEMKVVADVPIDDDATGDVGRRLRNEPD